MHPMVERIFHLNLGVDSVEHLDFEPSCEGNHSDPDDKECTVVVKYFGMVSCLGATALVCEGTAGYMMRQRGKKCVACGELTDDCWSIESIG